MIYTFDPENQKSFPGNKKCGKKKTVLRFFFFVIVKSSNFLLFFLRNLTFNFNCKNKIKLAT